MQLECQAFGNRVGVMSSILHNQQMLLREQISRSAKLEDTLSFLRAGVEASVDGIFVLEKVESGIDRDEFLFHYLNDSAALMLGTKPINVNHAQVKSAWKTSSAELLMNWSREVHATGKPRTLDPIQLEFLGGCPRWYSVKIAKIPGGVAWTVGDVTEREAMQREILAQRDRLGEANNLLTALDREKSEMLGMAAHDLRSPIGNIRALCELIETQEPETREFLDMICGISDSLLALIANLLDVERIERGELEIELVDMTFGPLAARLVDQFSAGAAQKSIEILLELPPKPLVIHADEPALLRVMQNLLSNAVKFSPPGSTVYLRAYETDQHVRIEIQDQGRGITEVDRKKLFAKFARLSTRPTANESSTGLGLSIVKRLVEAMDGQVGCDSEPGQGATFYLHLPKPQAKSEPAPQSQTAA